MATATQDACAWTAVDVRDAARAEPRAALAGVLLVVVFLGLPLFRGLRDTDLDNDEAIYSQCVDRVLESGAWLTLQGPFQSRFLEKPPLKVWIVAAGIRSGLLPHDAFGLRFWDALFGCAVFVYIFLLGSRLDGWICGVGAAFCLFLYRPLLADHGLRSNTMESLLLLAYVAGVYHFLRWTAAEHRRSALTHALAVGLWIAVAVLDKWLAAAFLPTALGVAIVADAEWRARAWRDRGIWAVALAVCLAVAAPWFVYGTFLFGVDFWRILAWDHVVRRFTEGLDPSHIQPWNFYFIRLWADAREFQNVALLGALLWHRRVFATGWGPGALVSLWILLPVATLSFGSSKLSHYLYPFVPPLALWGGFGIACTLRAAARATRGASPRAALPGPLVVLLLCVAAGALLLVLATCLGGPLHVSVFGLSVSSSTLRRPLAVAVFSTVCALAGSRTVPTVLAAAALACAAAPYQQALKPLSLQQQRVSRFAACLQDADRGRRAAFYLLWPKGSVLRNDVYYYMRGLRLVAPRLKRNGRHRVALRRQPRQAVFVVALNQLPAVRSRPGWRGIESSRWPVDLFDGRFFLPPAYASCAAALTPRQ